MGSEKLQAFCECWKEMIYYFNHIKGSKTDLNINNNIIEVFAHFF